jgi:methionine-gamma-lyase
VVVHSATKYLGGHADVVGGLALFADPEMHHRAWLTMIDLGASPDPFASWLVLRGVKTLALRMRHHSTNAAALAGLLSGHPKVTRVHWPGLAGHANHEVACRVLDGFGGFLAFDLAGGRDAGRRFIEATRLALLAPSLGGRRRWCRTPPPPPTASSTRPPWPPPASARAWCGSRAAWRMPTI